jgi:ABC-type nickel/cobalt efflux system permease component RcnA
MAPSGFFAPVTYLMLSLQREMTRHISRQLRAIRDGESGGALLFAAALGLLYGSLHTLGPGHGKFVVMTYFLSRDARPWRGFLMGGQIALFHVISAIVLLWLADLLSRRVFGLPAGEIQAVRQASYSAIALIGLYMLARAVHSLTRREDPHAGHDHPHGHHHGRHSHDLGQEGLLSFFVGLVPCTGAILVMLYALANNIVLAGILVVVAIGAGMALTMAGIGLLGMAARGLVLSRLEGGAGRGRWVAGAVQLAGGAAITAIGAAYFFSSL